MSRDSEWWEFAGVIILVAGVCLALVLNPTSDHSDDDDMVYDLERSLRISGRCTLMFENLEKAIANSSGETKAALSERLEVMEEIYYFSAASENCGEPFRYLGVIESRREDLVELGAVGCVKLIDELGTLYHQWVDLHHQIKRTDPSGEEGAYIEESEASNAFWKTHETEIERGQDWVESGDEMKLLLIDAGSLALREAGLDPSN